MADYDAIAQMLYRYCYAHDNRDIEGVKACFAKDMTIDGLSTNFNGLEGRDAIAAKYQAGYENSDAWRRHILSNIFIVDDRGDEADVRSYITLYYIRGNELTLQLTGTYRDTVVVEDGAWRIRHRVARMDVGPNPGPRPAAP